MKIIKKYSDEESIKYEPTSILDAQKHLDSEELNQDETLDYLHNKCPDLLILNKKLRYIKNKNKLIELIGRLENQA